MSQSLRPSCARHLVFACTGCGIAVIFLITGCGAEGEFGGYESQPAVESTLSPTSSTQPVAALVEEEAAVADEHLAKQMEARRIVYNAQMHLEVEQFEQAVDSLHKLVEEHEGFVASHEIDGGAGYRRSGHWKIRVPSKSFESFHAGLKAIGFPVKDSIDSKEVSEEYVDVERRIANMKRMEERLREHLEKSTKNLNDIFEVEKELTRVGAETERLQGRLQLLQDLTALATINLDITEKETYEPAPLSEPPVFTAQIASTFQESSDVLITVLKSFTLFLVGMSPWLPFLIILLLVLRYVYKKQQRASPEF